MVQILGNFRETSSQTGEFLLLSFSPSAVPIQKRWRNNGLSANFIADYLTTFFPIPGHQVLDERHNEEIKSAVSYIANELLENAMKFSLPEHPSSIRFGLYLLPDERDEEGVTIILSTTNTMPLQSVQAFQSFIHEFLTTDADELYVRQVERSMNPEENTMSGLGFITIKNDYSAELGWKFEPPAVDAEQAAIAVTTMVQLKV